MRKFVYVAKGNGEFEGRQVQLGPAGTDYYPVLAGLQEGERIVSQGSFLIDSQTRITGGMTGMFGGSKEFDHGQAEQGQTEQGQTEQGQAQAPAVPRSRKPDIPSDIERRIRQRAYELHEQRDRVNGFVLDDWLRAEANIRGAPKSDPKAKPSRRRES